MKSLSKAKRAALREMFGGRCAYCGHPLGEKWHADHVEPVNRIGEWVPQPRLDGRPQPSKYVQTGRCNNPENDHEANYFPACIACNINKGCAPLYIWRRCLGELAFGMRRDHASFRHAERFGLVVVVDKPVVFYFETFQNKTATRR